MLRAPLRRTSSRRLLLLMPFVLLALAGCTTLLGDFYAVSSIGDDAGIGASPEAGSAVTPDGAVPLADATTCATAFACDCRKDDAASPDGTPCGSVAGGVCADGKCVACTKGATCIPVDDPCKEGTLSCSAGPVCAGLTPAKDGKTCKADGHSVCVGGACVPKCDEASCADGCCSDLTTCVKPTTPQQCATGGKSCRVCGADYQCPRGACECPAGSGECNGVGNGCVSVTGTDGQNCGRCGHTCEEGSACVRGICKPTRLCGYAGAFVPSLLARSGTNGNTGYWAVTGVGPSGYPGYTIVSCDLTLPGAGLQEQNTKVGVLIDMQSDGDNGVYNTISSAISTCGIFHTTSGAGGTTTSTRLRTGPCSTLATDASNGRTFYVAGSDGSYSIDLIDRASSDGGTDSMCFPGFSAVPPLAAGGGAVVTAIGGTSLVATAGCSSVTTPIGKSASQPTAIGTDGTWVYFADTAGIHLCPLNGGCAAGALPLAAESAKVTRIAATATNIYWVGSNGLVTCARSGCNAPTVLVESVPTTTPFAVDAKYVYWVQAMADESVLYRAPN